MLDILWEHIVFNLIIFASAIIFAFDEDTDIYHKFLIAVEFWLMIAVAFYLTLFLVYIIVSHGGHLTI